MRGTRGRFAAGVVVAVVSVLAAPAGADDPGEIEAQLIEGVDGYTAQPEGEFSEGASGPFDIGDMAAMLDVDPELLPGSMGGYGRVFVSDEWEGHGAVVMGITGLDGDDLLDGFSAMGDTGEAPEQLFVDAEAPLDGLVSYSAWVPISEEESTQLKVTAFVADDLLIVVEVLGAVNGIATLRRAVKAQVELTPPTITPGYDPPVATDDPDPTDTLDADSPGTGSNSRAADPNNGSEESVAAGAEADGDDDRTTETFAWVLGILAVPAAIGLIACLVTIRSSHRKRVRHLPLAGYPTGIPGAWHPPSSRPTSLSPWSHHPGSPAPAPPSSPWLGQPVRSWETNLRPPDEPASPRDGSGPAQRDAPPPGADDWSTPG